MSFTMHVRHRTIMSFTKYGSENANKLNGRASRFARKWYEDVTKT
jgi:hypothetical protein